MTTTPTSTGTATEHRLIPAAPIVSAGDTLRVLAWRDPTVEQAPGAIRTDSDEALVWYTPVLGPTAVLLAHRLARYAAQGSSEWSPYDLALTFGMYGHKYAARLAQTVGRLERFGVAHHSGSVLSVRLWLPPLTFQQRTRLPDYLAASCEPR